MYFMYSMYVHIHVFMLCCIFTFFVVIHGRLGLVFQSFRLGSDLFVLKANFSPIKIKIKIPRRPGVTEIYSMYSVYRSLSCCKFLDKLSQIRFRVHRAKNSGRSRDGTLTPIARSAVPARPIADARSARIGRTIDGKSSPIGTWKNAWKDCGDRRSVPRLPRDRQKVPPKHVR